MNPAAPGEAFSFQQGMVSASADGLVSRWGGRDGKALEDGGKPAARIGVLTTIITLTGMTPLRLVVPADAASVVKSGIARQMTAAAEKSASVSKELSQQAQTLNRLISRFRIR